MITRAAIRRLRVSLLSIFLFVKKENPTVDPGPKEISNLSCLRQACQMTFYFHKITKKEVRSTMKLSQQNPRIQSKPSNSGIANRFD